MAEKTVFSAKGLCFAYGNNPVLNDISFTINQGRFYGIVGPNGSGKTTLMDLLAGYKKPTGGEVFFREKRLGDYSSRELARSIAVVPQEFTINFPFTVGEIVLMGRHPHMTRFARPSEIDLEIVYNSMKEIGVSEFENKYVTDLSGGEKQRVVLARALAQDTPVMLLDEPTSNLDIQHALHILQVASAKVASGRTVAAIMHDLNLAAAYCDELVFLKDGSIHAVGTVEATLTPENVSQVFGVEAKIYFDDFSQSRRIVYRKESGHV